MADYTLSARGTYDGSNFNKGISGSSSALDSFVQKCGGVGSKVSSTVAGITSIVGKATAVVGAFASGAFVKGGIDRALNIEQAQFKLGQLGMDVQSVMASANTAVDGTAFSLASAATSASLMGAAGVAAGDQMTRALQASAGVAAIGGVEMERVSTVFSKVAAQGKLQGDELMQLSEMGVNATAALGKHLGKTQAEVRDMVSAGEIDFQTFSDAMYETFGEAAYGANATFSGAMSNVGSALSRVSAKFADPALQALKGVFVALIPAINAVGVAVGPLVARFTDFANAVSGRVVSGLGAFTAALNAGQSPMQAFKAMLGSMFEGTRVEPLMDKVTGFFKLLDMGVSPMVAIKAYAKDFGDYVSSGLSGAIDKAREKVASLPQPVQSVISAFQSFGDRVSSVLGGVSGEAAAFGGMFAIAFAKFHAPISTAMGLIGTFAAKVGGISGVVSSVVSSVGGVVASIGTKLNTFGSAVTLCGGGVKGLVTVLGGMINPVTLVVGAIAALVAAFVYLMATNEGFRTQVMELVGQIGASLAPALTSIGTMVSNLATTVLPLISSVIGMILPVIGQVITLILQIVAALAPLISTLVSTLLPILTVIIQAVVTVASQIIAAVLPVISSILSAVQTALPIIQTIFEVVMYAVLAVINAVWPVIQAVIETVMGVIQSVIEIVTGIIEGDWDKVWNGIKSLFESIWNGMQGILAAALGVVKGAIDGALGFIKGIWDGAWSAVSSFVSDTWENIKTAVAQGVVGMMRFIEDIPGNIMGFFADAGSWLLDSGRSIIQGLADGIMGAVGVVTGAIDSVLGAVRNFLPFSPAKEGPFSGKGWTLYSGKSITEALGEGVAASGGKAVRAMQRVMGDMSEVSFAAPDVAYAGGYSFVPATPADAGSVESTTVYQFGDIYFEAHDLDGVNTMSDMLEIIKEAKDVYDR